MKKDRLSNSDHCANKLGPKITLKLGYVLIKNPLNVQRRGIAFRSEMCKKGAVTKGCSAGCSFTSSSMVILPLADLLPFRCLIRKASPVDMGTVLCELNKIQIRKMPAPSGLKSTIQMVFLAHLNEVLVHLSGNAPQKTKQLILGGQRELISCTGRFHSISLNCKSV